MGPTLQTSLVYQPLVERSSGNQAINLRWCQGSLGIQPKVEAQQGQTSSMYELLGGFFATTVDKYESKLWIFPQIGNCNRKKNIVETTVSNLCMIHLPPNTLLERFLLGCIIPWLFESQTIYSRNKKNNHTTNPSSSSYLYIWNQGSSYLIYWLAWELGSKYIGNWKIREWLCGPFFPLKTFQPTTGDSYFVSAPTFQTVQFYMGWFTLMEFFGSLSLEISKLVFSIILFSFYYHLPP